MRAIAIAIVTVACSRAHDEDRGPLARATCEAARTRQTAANQASERAYTNALAAKQLRPITLPMRFEPDDERLREPGTIEREATGQVVALEHYSGCKPRMYDLAEDARHRVFRVVREPRATSTETVTLCGCRPYDEGCGMNPGHAQMLVTLPSGASWGGDVTITYDAVAVSETYTQTRPNGEPCPPEVMAP